MKRLRVLIVDDDALFAKALESLLSGDGRFEIVGRAGNGVEAVAMAATLAPELILMDIEMPVMDGIEATRRISELDGTRVLVLTSSDSSAHVAGARRAGASGFLRKDLLDLSELLARVFALADSGLSPAPARSELLRAQQG
jgi:DNA-binding NarL/FixJ family response regulator